MIKECIILAGGFGTRLQSIVADIPKCMALINESPFIKYLLDYLEAENFNKVVLSLGYKSDIVIDWLKKTNYNMTIDYVVEKEPLGTGGAIKLATSLISVDNVFIYNGDTFFNIDSKKLWNEHINKKAEITIALKHLYNFDRYGTVNIDQHNRICEFSEKTHKDEGLINGGVYLIRTQLLNNYSKEVFSFEKEILEQKTNELYIYGYEFDSYFIDIGIPEDYYKMNIDFKNTI